MCTSFSLNWSGIELVVVVVVNKYTCTTLFYFTNLFEGKVGAELHTHARNT